MLRSSMMDLSNSLPFEAAMEHIQRHAPTCRADISAPCPSHPVQSVAETGFSSGTSSDIPEDIDGPAPGQRTHAHMLPTTGILLRQRISRPLSSSRNVAATPLTPNIAHLVSSVRTTNQPSSPYAVPQPARIGHTPTAPAIAPGPDGSPWTVQQSDQEKMHPTLDDVAHSADQVVETLGRGSGIMRHLQQRLAYLTGAEAAMMRNVLDTLRHAELHHGVNLSSVFTDVLNCGAPAEGSGRQNGGQRKAPAVMRLPRGLQPRGQEGKQMLRGQQNEWRLRLLAGYDDAQVVGLTGIALFDESRQRCDPTCHPASGTGVAVALGCT
jgi:hypothetical protein